MHPQQQTAQPPRRGTQQASAGERFVDPDRAGLLRQRRRHSSGLQYRSRRGAHRKCARQSIAVHRVGQTERTRAQRCRRRRRGGSHCRCRRRQKRGAPRCGTRSLSRLVPRPAPGLHQAPEQRRCPLCALSLAPRQVGVGSGGSDVIACERRRASCAQCVTAASSFKGKGGWACGQRGGHVACGFFGLAASGLACFC